MTLLVIGNAAVDRVLRVDALPRAGESVLASAATMRPGGKGFNQAASAGRSGAATRFLTVMGDDADGAFMMAAFAEERFTVETLSYRGPTDTSTILVGPGGDNIVVTTCGAADSFPADEAMAAAETLRSDSVLLMQGNLPGNLTADALSVARQRGARTVLNPSPARPGYERALEVADVLIVNQLEREALDRRRGQIILETLGAEGARLETDDGVIFRPARPVQTDDTTGAGDAFAGAFCAALVQGEDADSAAGHAMAAAASWLSRAV